MPRAYSQDLRDCVFDGEEKDGTNCRAAARHFGVSEASAIKWVQRARVAIVPRKPDLNGHGCKEQGSGVMTQFARYFSPRIGKAGVPAAAVRGYPLGARLSDMPQTSRRSGCH